MRIDDAFVADVLSAYSIKDPLEITEVKGVHASGIYHLQSADNVQEFALRITSTIDKRALLNELHIADMLSHSPLRVAKLLKTSENGLYIKSDGQVATLRTWIDGVHPEPGSITDAMLRNLGRALAVFHTAVPDLPRPNSEQLLQDDIGGWCTANRLVLGAGFASSPLWQALDSLMQTRLPRGIAHGDFHARNLLIDNDVVGILDMERSGAGTLLYDIARAAIDLCSDGDTFDASKSVEFIKGYAGVRPLSVAERSQYTAALAYAALAVSAWFYRHDLRQFGDHFVEVGEGALEYARRGVSLTE